MPLTAEIWRVPLQLLTPAFVGGALPNERADLRASGVRGALRAWYRLVVGPEVAAGPVGGVATPGPSGPRTLLSEAWVFGGVRASQGQGLVLTSLEDATPPGDLAWSSEEQRRARPGLAYLGFSLDLGANRRRALPPGTRFVLRLTFPRGLPTEVADALWATLGLWICCGGIGTRSRRGFGSLALADTPTVTDLRGRPRSKPPEEFGLAATGSAAGLQSLLRASLNRVRQFERAITDDGQKPIPREALRDQGPAYCLSTEPWPLGSRIVLYRGPRRAGFADATSALDAIGRALVEHRRSPGVDRIGGSPLRLYNERAFQNRAPERIGFGTPFAVRPVGANPRGLRPFTLAPVRPARDTGPHGRRGPTLAGRAPSPLMISIVRCGERYGVMLTLLAGPWPGRDLETAVLGGNAQAANRTTEGALALLQIDSAQSWVDHKPGAPGAKRPYGPARFLESLSDAELLS